MSQPDLSVYHSKINPRTDGQTEKASQSLLLHTWGLCPTTAATASCSVKCMGVIFPQATLVPTWASDSQQRNSAKCSMCTAHMKSHKLRHHITYSQHRTVQCRWESHPHCTKLHRVASVQWSRQQQPKRRQCTTRYQLSNDCDFFCHLKYTW